MTAECPPTIDPVAAARWARTPPRASAWLHEEVARRMEDRLQWIVARPANWVHWEPLQGGLQAHQLLTRRYPDANCFVVQDQAEQELAARKMIAPAWWTAARWRNRPVQFSAPQQPVQMLWANMALHMQADPQALLQRWHDMLDVDGFLMFSCLGPDTLRQLRRVYAALGWPAPSHEFIDMHDWGDMLVRCGFAEPVMDMERITLTFTSADTLLAELRGLGRNLHPLRFPGLRGRGWYRALRAAVARELASPGQPGRLELDFEVNYGHAFKPRPRLPLQAQTVLTLDAMRQALQQGKSR